MYLNNIHYLPISCEIDTDVKKSSKFPCLIMDVRRRTTSIRQLEILIEFMETHPDFALGRVRSKEARALASRLWDRCTEMLNAEGVSRSSKEWSRFWNDYKCRVRAKLADLNSEHRGTGGGPRLAPQLTHLEDRVASLLGRDAGPLTGVRRDPVMDVQINFEEDIPNDSHTVVIPPPESPPIDISFVNSEIEATEHILPQPSPNPDRTMTVETPQDDQLINPEPTELEQPISGNRRNVQSVPRSSNRQGRRQTRSQLHTHVNQSSSTLDEYRRAVARIEEMRTRMELLQSEAALKHAEAMSSIANSF